MWAAFLSLPWLLGGCGAKDIGTARSRGDVLSPGDAGLEVGGCRGDSDCLTDDLCRPRTCEDHRCVEQEPIACSDDDPCTVDACNSADGQCTFEPLTADVDGDGHRQPLAGFAPGAPGACGDDCDDRSERAFPGGAETCDGVDNDCNGVTDDSYVYRSPGADPFVVAEGKKGAESGGLVYTGKQLVALVTTHDERYQARLLGLGNLTDYTYTFESEVVASNNDTFAGGLTWSGQVLGVAWEDRRDNDYEIYFNRFDEAGRKLDPDLRISDAIGFSLDPSLLLSGDEYLIAWTDGRNGSDAFQVMAQRVNVLGAPIGGNVSLTPDFFNAKSAVLALGTTEVGLTFSASSTYGEQVVFRGMTHDLSALGPATVVSGPNAAGGGAVFAQDRYVVSWSEYTPGVGPGDSIWAAAVDRNGTVLQQTTRLTPSGGFARSHSVLSLGDRILVAWAFDSGQSYDIFTQMFSKQLEPLGEPLQVTDSALDEIGPRLRFGPEGEVALVYSEHTNDRGPRVLMEMLSCR